MSYDVPTEFEKTAFGQLAVNNEQVIAQISAQAGIIDTKLFIATSGGDSDTTVAEDKFRCSSGTSPGGVASILTLRTARYRAGEGLVCRLSAIFLASSQDSQQLAGFISSSSGMTFAMVNGTFGVLHYFSGQTESQELEVTTPAGGVELASVGVDGALYAVPLTAGTIEENALEIAESLNDQVGAFLFTANGATVVAQALIAGETAAFSFTSATAVATWTEITAGEPIISNFTPRDLFNNDNLSWLNPALGNIYQVEYGSLGFGNISFSVLNPETGQFVLAHMIEYANSSVEPSSSQPAFRCGWASQNTGSTENNAIEGAGCGVFNQGEIYRDGGIVGIDNDQPSVGIVRTNIVSIRNRISFAGQLNRYEVLPLILSAASQTDKVAFVDVVTNPTFVLGDVNFEYHDKENSLIEISTDSATVFGGDLLASFTVTEGTPVLIKFNETTLRDSVVSPGQVLTVAARMSANPASDVQASITFLEDQ